jgi:F-type H+-transporting ATPase subunit b
MLIDWFTVAAQAVNFLLLVWLLKRFLYKPVLAALDEREKSIEAQLKSAEDQKSAAEKEQTDFLHKNEEFERQRAAQLLESTNAAKTERERLLETARKDSEELGLKLKKDLSDELDNLNRKIETLARQEVFAIARKTLADLADVTLEERVADIFIRRIGAMNDKQRAEIKESFSVAPGSAVVRSAFELAPPQKKSIEESLKPLFGENTEVKFETKSDLITGIEFVANGQKIAWSISDYLNSLTDSVSELLDPKIVPAPVSQKIALPHAA